MKAGKIGLMLVVCMMFVNQVFSQTEAISLKLKDVTLDQVFEAIEKLSEYTFLYSDDQMEKTGLLTLDYKNTSIEIVLKECLRKSGITYVVLDHTIVLKPGIKPGEGSFLSGEMLREYIVVEGWVRDKKDRALSGVNIFVKNYPGMGMVTDETGYFKTKVRLSDVLVFSYVGFTTRELFVKKMKKGGKIILEEEQREIGEVQVVGYGTQRKVTVTGAISEMQIEGRNFPVTSFSNMIAGNVSGIIGVQRSGEPGQDVSEFWIRGMSTFGANDKALILVDGVERSTVNDIIPEDIAAFSVLKDASATAVYGARGANGVILMQTKMGKSGRMKIDVDGRHMWSCLPRLPRYLKAYDYARLANEARAVRGESPVYDREMFEVIRYHLDPDLYPDVSWQDEILKKWTRGAQVHLGMSGGGDIARYYLSLNYKTNDAAYKESGLKRYHTNVLRKQYSFRTNLGLNITPSTEMEVRMATTVVDLNRPGIGRTDSIWEAQAMLNPLTVPVRYSTGHLPAYGDGSRISPAVLLNETGWVNEFRNDMEFKLEVRQKIFSDWHFSAALAYDMTNVHSKKREKMPELFMAKGRNVKGELILESMVPAREMTFQTAYSGERRLYVEMKADYEHNWKNHRLGGMLLFNLSQQTFTEAEDEISAIPFRRMGIAGRLTYSCQDIYLSELNFGYNGTENFPKGKRFCFFPSASVGWVVSGYPAIQEKWTWLRLMKIRYSLGVVGNDQIHGSRFPYLTYISSDAPGYAFGERGENVRQGITESSIGARHLIWEKALKHDVGIDIDVGGKFRFNADYFNTVRRHIFMPRNDVPDITGWPNVPYGNVGKMRNSGFDATLYYGHKIGSVALEWRGNITYTENKVLEYDEADVRYEYQRQKGKSLDQARGYIALGYFRDSLEIIHSPLHPGPVRPGDLKYKDVNGDGVINEQDIVPIGNSVIPRIQYGIAGSMKWKAWDISVFCRGAGAVSFFYGGTGFFPFMNGTLGNILTDVGEEHNRWIPAWYSGDPATENPDARFPRLSYGENTNNFVPSTHWLANGAYFRLKTVEIGYSVPVRLLRRFHMEMLRLSLLGDNLHVWDKVHSWDPEQASSNGAVYPLTRSWLINLQLKF